MAILYYSSLNTASVTEKKLSEDAQAIPYVPTSHKVVELTIDDGPHYKVTPEILAILKEKQVKFNKIAKEFDKAEKVIAATAPKPTLFRPPSGFYNSQVI